MKQVSKEEFYGYIGKLDVIHSIKGNYPYSFVWTFRNGRDPVAKAEPDGEGRKYYIRDNGKEERTGDQLQN